MATDGLLAAFAKRRSTAVQHYIRFVSEGLGGESIWNDLKAQAFLGDDDFVARSLKYANVHDDVNISKSQRRAPPLALAALAGARRTRNEAMIAAHASGGYSYQQIADYLGVHFTTVGRVVRDSKSR